MVNDLISDDIKDNRDRYMEIMREHGSLSPQDIIESVRATQDELYAAFSSVSDDDAGRKPAPDEWSLHDLARHAVFTERLIAKLIHHGARGSLPPAEDLEGAGIGMMPREDDRSYRELLDELRNTNTAVLDAVRSLPEQPDLQMKVPHPYFGELTCLEWAGFQRVHDLDHIQHARKIIATLSA